MYETIGLGFETPEALYERKHYRNITRIHYKISFKYLIEIIPAFKNTIKTFCLFPVKNALHKYYDH